MKLKLSFATGGAVLLLIFSFFVYFRRANDKTNIIESEITNVERKYNINIDERKETKGILEITNNDLSIWYTVHFESAAQKRVEVYITDNNRSTKCRFSYNNGEISTNCKGESFSILSNYALVSKALYNVYSHSYNDTVYNKDGYVIFNSKVKILGRDFKTPLTLSQKTYTKGGEIKKIDISKGKKIIMTVFTRSFVKIGNTFLPKWVDVVTMIGGSRVKLKYRLIKYN